MKSRSTSKRQRNFLSLAGLTAAVFLVVPVTGSAASMTWDGVSRGNDPDYFTNAQNWRTGTVETGYQWGVAPGTSATDIATIADGGWIFLDSKVNEFAELNLNWGRLSIGADVPAVGEAAASITVTTANIGGVAGGNIGRLELGGNSALTATTALNLTGGTLSLLAVEGSDKPTLTTGKLTSTNGTFSIDGGEVKVTAETFVMDGGSFAITNGGKLDVSSGTQNQIQFTSGTITMTDGSITGTKNLRIARGETVDLAMTNSTWYSGDRIYLGVDAGTANVILTDSSIESHYYFLIGYKGTATITLNGNSWLKKNAESADNLIIGNGTAGNATITLNDTSYIQGQKEIYIGAGRDGAGNGGQGTVNMNSGTKILAPGGLRVGVGGEGTTTRTNSNKGTVNMYAGSSVEALNGVEIGYDKGEGRLNMTDSSMVINGGNLHIGLYAGDGVVNMQGSSTISIADGLNVGNNNRDTTVDEVKYVMKGVGVLNMKNTYDTDGTTVIATNNSSISVVGGFEIGRDGSIGTVTMEGNASIVGQNSLIFASNGGNAKLYMSENATIVIEKDLSVGHYGESQGLIDMSGNSKLTIKGNAEIGNGGGKSQGTVNLRDKAELTVIGNAMAGRWSYESFINMNGESKFSAAKLNLGHYYSDGAVFNMYDRSVATVTGTVQMGEDNAKGNLTMDAFTPEGGGTPVINNSQFLIKGAGSQLLMGTNEQTGGAFGNSTVKLTGNALLSTEDGNIVVGHTGSGTLTINDHATVKAGGVGRNIYIGGDLNGKNTSVATPTGAVTLNGGTLDASQGAVILGAGPGSAGRETTYTHESAPLTTAGGSGVGTLTLNGGKVLAQGITKGAGGTATVSFNGGTIQATAGNTDFFAGFSSSDLVVQAGGVTFNTGGFDIGITQGLTGTGTLTKLGAGKLTLGGDNSGYTGAVHVTEGNVEVVAGTTLSIVLNNAANGSDAENKYVLGDGINIVLDSSARLNVVLSGIELTESDVGNVYNVFTGSGVSIGNAGDIIAGNASGYEFMLNANGTLTLTAVPEPSTYGLLGGISLLGLVALRRRRK